MTLVVTQSPVSGIAASREFLQRIPRDFARRHLVLSQGRCEDIERLASSANTDPAVIHNIGVRLGRTVEAFTADGEVIARAIDGAYTKEADVGTTEAPPLETSSSSDASDAAVTSEIDRLLAEADCDLLSTQGKGPVVKLVDALLFEALGRRATDVHVQPIQDRRHGTTTLVRYRLDGVLNTVREIARPVGLAAAVISRIKVMGRMDIAERRVPQDGRATVTIGERSIDLRISIVPTSHGERAVIRLLDHSQELSELDQLGMPPDVILRFMERATRSGGIILVTGPTGSGKTTTLYSTLRRIGSITQNVVTIEDPIEYELSDPDAGVAISQMQVNPRKGINFATGLRHILRQDPDVIMVGEIRDAETARIAIQSSLTGHLVFSTLHTNDAPGAVTRLIDLGVEPYLVSASLSAVLAQRLVRLVHSLCAGAGCPECLGTGFRGRSGVFELLVVDEAMRGLIAQHASHAVIRGAAVARGMRTLQEEGRRLVTAGITTAVEVDRVIQADVEETLA